ncbi:unnamed protein product [Linum tenue]|uniref:Uncharacterized protein n=1 Tax=Linum tenue TaxID=586396 RepID=A0AAV0IES1_9ROSI|nr:unnamed protein product [Linum tenue]
MAAPTVIIIVVFISFGGFLCLAGLAAVVLCCLKKLKKKPAAKHEVDLIHVDEHARVKEAVVPGCAVVLEIEEDLHVDEVVRKDDEVGAAGHHHLHGLHGKSAAAAGVGANSEATAVASSGGAAREVN